MQKHLIASLLALALPFLPAALQRTTTIMKHNAGILPICMPIALHGTLMQKIWKHS
jgi:hypothetical protein